MIPFFLNPFCNTLYSYPWAGPLQFPFEHPIVHLGAVHRIPMHGPIRIPDGICDGPDLAVLDLLAVEGGDGHDAARGRAHEDLVGLVCKADGHDLAADLDAMDPGRVKDALPRDTVQDAPVGRVQDPVFDEDDIEPRPLGQIRVAVRQERIHGLSVPRLVHAADQISPLQVLDRRIDRTGRDTAHCARNDRAAAHPLDLGLHAPHVRDDEHVQRVHDVFGPRLAHAVKPACDDQLDERVADPRLRRHLEQQLLDLRLGLRQLQPDLLAAEFQPVQVVVQPEKPPVPHRRHVVCQVAVQEALVSQRNARLVEWHQLAFNPRDPLSERVAAARQDRLACLVVAEDLLHSCHLGEAVMEFGIMCL